MSELINSRSQAVFLFIKRLLFPGIDENARQRLYDFRRYFRTGDLYTLDVGSGNGAYALECYRRGNRALGIDVNADFIKRCSQYAEYIHVDTSRCRFETFDAFALESREEQFDQIVCFEVLEHLREDERLLRVFYQILKVGGVLHVSTPYLLRKPLYGEYVSKTEDGGHLRLGYTYEQLEAMLKVAGFKTVCRDGSVGPVSVKISEAVRWVEHHLGRVMSALSWLLLSPLALIDRLMPSAPRLQIYVMAVKENGT